MGSQENQADIAEQFQLVDRMISCSIEQHDTVDGDLGLVTVAGREVIMPSCLESEGTDTAQK